MLSRLRNAIGTASSARHHPLLRAAGPAAAFKAQLQQLQQQVQGFASAEVRTRETT